MKLDMKQVHLNIEKGIQSIQRSNAKTMYLCNRVNQIAKNIREKYYTK